jgi:cyclophilin family peptidyl-prolyl cis-trans isomerase
MLLLIWGIGLGLIPGAATTAAFAFQDPGQPQVPEKTETPVEQEKQSAPESPLPATAEAAPQEKAPAKTPAGNAPVNAAGNAQESIGPMVQAYLNKRKEFRDLDGKINQILTSVSLTAAADYQAMVERLKNLRERKAELGNEILDASVDAYLESPDRFREVNDDLTKLMRSLLGEQGTSSRFDPQKARDIAERLINARAKNLNVHFYGSYAAYCLNEFDLARKWLDRLLEAGAKPEQTILKQIEDASAKWGRELALREADTQTQVPQVAVQTELGEFVVELYENEAPNTVANFIMLVEKKYYDGSFFYLSQPGRLAMAGCTKGDGQTNAGYFIPDEVDQPEIRHHFSGVLAMAAEEPNTGSARFSILQQPTPGGDGKLTVFGRIISGLDVIYRVPAVKPTDIKLGAKPVKIESMRVVRKRDHAYEPKTIPLSEAEKSGK